jgi:hypothetical protein
MLAEAAPDKLLEFVTTASAYDVEQVQKNDDRDRNPKKP